MSEEDIAEGLCFYCKDGGELMVCDYKDCCKVYHVACVSSPIDPKETWMCEWHTCFICNKSSKIQCFCCPKAVCFTCIEEAEFVQVKEKSRGFCSNCLKLSLLIEKNAEVDSEGEKVSFEDNSTFEFLFRDYWEIVKEKEKLSLKDLQIAKASMERNQQLLVDSGSDKDSGEGELYKKKCRQNGRWQALKGQPKRRNFINWGSEDLIKFLVFVGKDVREPHTQQHVSEIIKKYISDKNLTRTGKKKKQVICDEHLISLFKKKKVNILKIDNLLESHFAHDKDSDDDLDMGIKEGGILVNRKRKSNSHFDDTKRCHESNNCFSSLGHPRSRYASVTRNNIQLVYLRRSLVQELLKSSDFEDKVTGGIVRVKIDPKDIFRSPGRIYEIGQVASIRKAKEPYKIGEISTDVVLRISTIWKDIHISMLSEDDFEEEECVHLRHLVKKGLHPRPLIEKFEKKVADLHECITVHWINREVAKLQKQIDRANEKGWRREFFELMEKRSLLSSQAEKERLLRVIPKVIPDDTVEDTINTRSQVDNKGGAGDKKERPTQPPEMSSADCKLVPKRNSDSQLLCRGELKSVKEIELLEETEPISCEKAEAEQLVKDEPAFIGTEAISCEKAEAEQPIKDRPAFIGRQQKDKPLEAPVGTNCSIDPNLGPAKVASRNIPVIDLVDDDEDEDESNNTIVSRDNDKNPNGIITNDEKWHYLDPAGTVRGPFPLSSLGTWQDCGYFDQFFKVWRHGHSQDDAILLVDALRLHS